MMRQDILDHVPAYGTRKFKVVEVDGGGQWSGGCGSLLIVAPEARLPYHPDTAFSEGTVSAELHGGSFLFVAKIIVNPDRTLTLVDIPGASIGSYGVDWPSRPEGERYHPGSWLDVRARNMKGLQKLKEAYPKYQWAMEPHGHGWFAELKKPGHGDMGLVVVKHNGDAFPDCAFTAMLNVGGSQIVEVGDSPEDAFEALVGGWRDVGNAAVALQP